MTKKIVAVFLICFICAATFTGCSGGTAQTPAVTDTPKQSDQTAPQTTPPAAEKQVIMLTHTSADTASHHKAALEFQKLVQEKSGGKFEVQVYPAAQLGNDMDITTGVNNDNITLALTGPAYLGNFVSQSSIFDMPFLLTTPDSAKKAFSNENFLNSMNQYYTQNNFRLIGIQFLGFRCLTLNKEVHAPADLTGQKIRTMENKFHIATWKALGANPTPLAYNELYTALQQGTVDGQENPIELIYSQKFYEQQKYIIKTNHVPMAILWVMSNHFYESLSDSDKALINESAKAGIEVGLDYMDKTTQTNIDAMEDTGVKVIDLTEGEFAQFKAKVETIYPSFKEAVGEDIYNAYMKAIE